METKDTAVVEEQYEEISLLDLAIIFAKQKWTIIVTTLLFIALGFGYLFATAKPVLYKSNLQILPVATDIVNRRLDVINVGSAVVMAVVQSDSVKADVEKKFSSDEFNSMEVSKDDKLETITISAFASTPEKAQEIVTYIFDVTEKKVKEIVNSAVEVVDNVNAAAVEREVKNKVKDSDSSMATLKLYDVLSAKEESAKMRGKVSVAIQLLSPASAPVKAESGGRTKTLVLFTMLGFFLGLVLAFMKYVWSTVDEAKKQELKAALRLR